MQIVETFQADIENHLYFIAFQFFSFLLDQLGQGPGDCDLILWSLEGCFSASNLQGHSMCFMNITIELIGRMGTKGNWVGKPLVTMWATASEVCSKRGMESF